MEKTMNNVIISYRDRNESRPDRYEAGPYHASSVKAMAGLLRSMGCTDFKFIQTKKKALAD